MHYEAWEQIIKEKQYIVYSTNVCCILERQCQLIKWLQQFGIVQQCRGSQQAGQCKQSAPY